MAGILDSWKRQVASPRSDRCTAYPVAPLRRSDGEKHPDGERRLKRLRRDGRVWSVMSWYPPIHNMEPQRGRAGGVLEEFSFKRDPLVVSMLVDQSVPDSQNAFWFLEVYGWFTVVHERRVCRLPSYTQATQCFTCLRPFQFSGKHKQQVRTCVGHSELLSGLRSIMRHESSMIHHDSKATRFQPQRKYSVHLQTCPQHHLTFELGSSSYVCVIWGVHKGKYMHTLSMCIYIYVYI